MTTIREVLRRLIGNEQEAIANQPRPHYSYRIYWTKMVRDWPQAKRQTITEQLAQAISRDDFEPNPLERRYRLDALGESDHAGASLLALQEVLEGFRQFDADQEENEE
jgi:hypothetical protein